MSFFSPFKSQQRVVATETKTVHMDTSSQAGTACTDKDLGTLYCLLEASQDLLTGMFRNGSMGKARDIIHGLLLSAATGFLHNLVGRRNLLCFHCQIKCWHLSALQQNK